MLVATDPPFTPVQQAVVDRLDAAVSIGVVGLAVVILLLTVLVVRSFR